MSKLDFLNRFILQWFFIRLCRSEDRVKEIISMDIYEVSMMDSRTAAIGSRFDEWQYRITRWWCIMAWVVPTSGYGNAFRYIGRSRYWRVSRVTVTIEGPPPPEDFNCRSTVSQEYIEQLRKLNEIPPYLDEIRKRNLL